MKVRIRVIQTDERLSSRTCSFDQTVLHDGRAWTGELTAKKCNRFGEVPFVRLCIAHMKVHHHNLSERESVFFCKLSPYIIFT